MKSISFHPEQSKSSPLSIPPRFTTTSRTYAQEVYQGVVADEEVEALLQEEYMYDSSGKRWSFPFGADDLLHNVFSIFQLVVERLVVPQVPGVERMVLSTNTTPGCDGLNRDGYRICPILLVRATGPSFELPSSRDGPVRSEGSSTSVGFANIATYFTIRAEEELGTEEDLVNEMKSYARLIFCAQANRFYVRSLVISEKYARLVHIDRGGAQITPPIDIHQDPGTLIRVVAGLCSTNERLLGIDDSIQWSIVDGRKAEGTLTTTGPSGSARTFRILEWIPIPRDSIPGRGTTCWRVQDPDTLEEYIVKDGWRPDFLNPEHDLLRLVKGVAGLVQMVSHETDRGEIRDFRCPTTSGQYHNRVASRTTTKAYGKSIVSFTSILQPLYALRDAISGHQRLCGDRIRIVHRDISHNNVLLGREGAPVGERGILIDLDLAFKATDAEPFVRTNCNIGTRLFQSVSVLEGWLAHDHIDELESFFYLMAYILLLFRPDGTRVPSNAEGPAMIRAWGVENIEDAEESKKRFRDFGPPAFRSHKLIRASWGQECADLFQNFRFWVMERADDKAELFEDDGMYGKDGRKNAEAIELFYARRDEHYAEVLQMFDEATTTIKASIPAPSENASTPAMTPPDETQPAVPNCGHTPDIERPIVSIPPPALTTHDPVVESAAFTHATTSRCPARVGLSPIPLPHPVPSTVPAPPRRSARTQEVRLQKSRQCLVHAINAPRPMTRKTKVIALSQSTALEPRRSSRIQKRRLDEEEQAVGPHRKVPRTTKAPRRSTRSR